MNTMAKREQSVFDPKESTGITGWVQEMMNREDEAIMGVVYAGQRDGVWRVPEWASQKNVDVAGRPVTQEARAFDANYFTTRYKEELKIAEQRMIEKADRYAATSESSHFRRRFLTWWNRPDEQAAAEAAAAEAAADKADVEKRARATKAEASRVELYNRARLQAEQRAKASSAWETMVESLSDDQPLLWKIRGMRNTYDCYGIDDFVDSPLSLLLLGGKLGAAVGILHGGVRAFKVASVDALYMHASGQGFLTFVNVSIFMSAFKWSLNFIAVAAAFSVGDRLCREVKRATLPPDVAPMRTPANYACGMALGLSTAASLPMWFLQDRRMALRTFASGAVLGGVLGYAMGYLLHVTLALNLQRLEYRPGQFRAYQALVKRERANAEAIKARLRGEALEPTLTKAY